MRKIAVYLIIACTLMMFSACEKQADLSAVKAIDNIDQQSLSDEESSKETFINEISKESYTEIPEEATEALNSVAEISKEIYPDADGKWMYGYNGKEKINGEDCYVFTVYTETEDSGNKLGVIARATKSGNIYSIDEDAGTYKKIPANVEFENTWSRD